MSFDTESPRSWLSLLSVALVCAKVALVPVVFDHAAPEKGFVLMRQCASWNDPDINWVLRENLKKKRLAKFVGYTEGLSKLLA